MPKKKSIWLAVALNLIYGLGYLYIGEWARFALTLIAMIFYPFIYNDSKVAGAIVLITMIDVYVLTKKLQ